jgi:hypothetical protein
MAKNKISEYSATAANNTDIGGINISEGCAPSGINNAIRELMAQLKDQQVGTDGDNFTVGGAFTCTGAAVFSSTVAIGGAISLSSALPVTSGGTGVSSVTTGDILYASGSNTLAKLAGAATTGQVLLSGVSAPSWGKVGLTTAVSGTLPIANGGTGLTSVGTDGQVLTSTGTATAWETPAVQPAIGVGQTWQKPSRSLNTSYTNSTGKPIMVTCSPKAQSGTTATAVVDGVTILNSTTIDCCGVPQISYFPFSFIVPDGSTYRVNGSYDFRDWAELR